ncbi:MAG: ribonuclease P protein component 1 [Halococcoides sp.]
MALTPATLPRHELLGLPASVRAADDEGRVGAAGRIVEETTETLVLGADRAIQVPKGGTEFAIGVPRDGDHRHAAPAAEDCAWVAVSGDRLIARPARRTELRGDSTWR